jgi:hypothetical protein
LSSKKRKERLTSKVTEEVTNRNYGVRVDESAGNLESLLSGVGREGLLDEHLFENESESTSFRFTRCELLTEGVFLGKCFKI